MSQQQQQQTPMLWNCNCGSSNLSIKSPGVLFCPHCGADLSGSWQLVAVQQQVVPPTSPPSKPEQ